jgi:TRAP-type C4-dicarboxylate transport system permease small subunit
MSDAASGESPSKEDLSKEGGGGFFGAVRRVDDAIFALEQALVTGALLLITLMVFLDVVARRLTAGDSKVGQLLANLLRIEDRETLHTLHHQIAPWVGLLLAFLLLAFAITSSHRNRKKKEGEEDSLLDQVLAKPWAPWVGSALLIAAVYGLSQAMLGLDSKDFYAALFGASTLAYLVHVAREREGLWWLRLIAGLIVGAGGIAFTRFYIPIGYSWSKELSLMLLLWVGFLGASICAHEGKHLRMGALSKLVPKKGERFVLALGYLTTAAFCALMAWLGFAYIFDPITRQNPSWDAEMRPLFNFFGTQLYLGYRGAYSLGGVFEQTGVPDWIATIAVPIAFGLTMVRYVGAAISALLGGSYGKPAAEEGMEEAKALAEESTGKSEISEEKSIPEPIGEADSDPISAIAAEEEE